jgi:glycerol-3-phosphate dehydrogenase
VNVDLLVVGGGVNGTAIARDAAGRGLSVFLCEQDDLAAHTSSSSTKLVHGGLRYMEQYEFALVRKALIEREVLLAAAPHIIWPLRFVLPHESHLRPAWMIRIGLFLYDHLARRRLLPASRAIDLRRHPAGAPLAAQFVRGFEYSDGWVEDSRLVVLNALDARERGACIATRTRCVAARRDGGLWHARLQEAGGRTFDVIARGLVDAAGPWVGRLLNRLAGVGQQPENSVRLVKGSHIIVPRIFTHEFAYIFQNPDRRIVFAIPYEREFTLIGTTDVDYRGDPSALAIDAEETAYLCAAVTRYFRQPVTPDQVIASFAGVRPLLDDEAAGASEASRDYLLELDTQGAPLLAVFGGKITTSRRLAEEALDLLAQPLGVTNPAWTVDQPLPGGDLPGGDFATFLQAARQRWPWLPTDLARRYARAYGTRMQAVIGPAQDLAGLGTPILPGLYCAEVDYLRQQEFARTADDILWRRSKLRLHLPPDSTAVLERWLAGHPVP